MGSSIDQVVDGSYLETPRGNCFVVERAYPAGHPHGAYRVDEALEVEPEQLLWLGRDPRLAEMDLARFAFVDTETTGLAGGTGTYAFLIGLGYFQGGRFVVRQFFMEDLDAEEAALHAFAESLRSLEGLVTFNGKAFDLPLLETRFQMARIPFPLRDAPHLDLLFPSRRLWKDRLDSCALSSLEIEILGVEREGDVPGWLIPSLYFGYLRDRDARPLAPVFEHNRIDLLSLATLATRLARQHADPFHPEMEDPRDLAALGVVFEGLGLPERAALCYERAVALATSGELRGRAMVRLGTIYKRLRLRGDAIAIWERLAASGHAYTLVAFVEMAKHYEHVAKDYQKAERVTLQALAALELRASRFEPWRAEQQRRELEHRLARLRRRLGRRLA
ncbi:MAG: ribonuclease H-like domain-containing protein [Sphingomonadaceae bacterium]